MVQRTFSYVICYKMYIWEEGMVLFIASTIWFPTKLLVVIFFKVHWPNHTDNCIK